MNGCPYVNDPKTCIETRRTSFTGDEYRPWLQSSCENCKAGKEHEIAAARERRGKMADEKVLDRGMPKGNGLKEKVFQVIQRRRRCFATPIMQLTRATADQLREIAPALEKEGKIKIWPYRNTAIYTLPGETDPRPAGASGKGKDAQKLQQNVKQRQTAAASPGKIPPKNGGGSTGFAGDLDGFMRIQDQFYALVSAMIVDGGEGLEKILDEIVFVALNWRRDRRASAP